MKLFLILFLPVITFACEMKLPAVIVFLTKTITPQDWQPLMKGSNCSPEIAQNILERLLDAEGKVSAEQFTADYLQPVTITPAVFEVTNLESLLHQKSNQIFKKISLSGNTNSRLFTVENKKNISITCQNCNENTVSTSTFGRQGEKIKNLQWSIQVQEAGQDLNFLVFTEPAVIRKALVAKSTMKASAGLLEENFEEKFVSDVQGTPLVISENNSLQNYTLIKDLQSGDVLTSAHVSAKKLVSIGRSIEALIKSNGVEMTIPAQALESGTLGQQIQVKNLKNKKQMPAEVIGLNKVLINL